MTTQDNSGSSTSNWANLITAIGGAAGNVLGATNQTKTSDLVKLANAQAAQQQAAANAQATQQRAWLMPVLIGVGILAALGLALFAFTRGK